jgi:long-chain acyl-CoA synthetase
MEPRGATSDFLEEVSRAEPIADPIVVDVNAPAFILPTGGTTGHPKAVTLSHRNLLANALQLKAWCGNRTGRNIMLAAIPFFHSYGLSTCVTSGVAMAATLVLYHRFEPLAILKLIETARPNVFPAVPAMLNLLNQKLRQHKHRWNVKSLMWVISGGAALPADTCFEFADRWIGHRRHDRVASARHRRADRRCRHGTRHPRTGPGRRADHPRAAGHARLLEQS